MYISNSISGLKTRRVLNNECQGRYTTWKFLQSRDGNYNTCSVMKFFRIWNICSCIVAISQIYGARKLMHRDSSGKGICVSLSPGQFVLHTRYHSEEHHVLHLQLHSPFYKDKRKCFSRNGMLILCSTVEEGRDQLGSVLTSLPPCHSRRPWWTSPGWRESVAASKSCLWWERNH